MRCALCATGVLRWTFEPGNAESMTSWMHCLVGRKVRTNCFCTFRRFCLPNELYFSVERKLQKFKTAPIWYQHEYTYCQHLMIFPQGDFQGLRVNNRRRSIKGDLQFKNTDKCPASKNMKIASLLVLICWTIYFGMFIFVTIDFFFTIHLNNCPNIILYTNDQVNLLSLFV